MLGWYTFCARCQLEFHCLHALVISWASLFGQSKFMDPDFCGARLFKTNYKDTQRKMNSQ